MHQGHLLKPRKKEEQKEEERRGLRQQERKNLFVFILEFYVQEKQKVLGRENLKQLPNNLEILQ